MPAPGGAHAGRRGYRTRHGGLGRRAGGGALTAAPIETQVLVVGAGPGGSATAYHLASRGIDVLLVDRAVFPREKVCGDGLSPRGVRALRRMGVDPSDPAFVRVDALRTYGVGGFVEDYPWPRLADFPDFGLVRTRYEFDHLLVRQAVGAGAAFREGVEVDAPIVEGGWVTGAVLNRDGEASEVRARFVVAADGASSRFASRAGVRRDASRPVAIAARRYFRTTRPPEPVFEAFLDLHDPTDALGGLLPGYGWIFPLPDGVVNVGAGVLNTFHRFKEVSAKRVMDVFLAQLPPEWGIGEESAVGPLLSGPIPMGINRDPVAVPGLLLVGDAAGVTNPFNGEGIAYAMETGELAAELLGDALARNRPAIAHLYPILLRERYGAYFTIGNRWVRMIGNPRFMQLAVQHGFPRRRLMEFSLRLMANLTDGKKGDVQDKIMHALTSLVPVR